MSLYQYHTDLDVSWNNIHGLGTGHLFDANSDGSSNVMHMCKGDFVRLAYKSFKHN